RWRNALTFQVDDGIALAADAVTAARRPHQWPQRHLRQVELARNFVTGVGRERATERSVVQGGGKLADTKPAFARDDRHAEVVDRKATNLESPQFGRAFDVDVIKQGKVDGRGLC